MDLNDDGIVEGLLEVAAEGVKLLSNGGGNINNSELIDSANKREEGSYETVDDYDNRRRSSSAAESISSDKDEHEALMRKIMASNERGTELVKLSFNDIRYTVKVNASREEKANGAPAIREL